MNLRMKRKNPNPQREEEGANDHEALTKRTG